MNCERCNSLWGSEGVFRIRTDILDLKVCRQCAKEALALGLLVESLPDPTVWTEEKVVPAAV